MQSLGRSFEAPLHNTISVFTWNTLANVCADQTPQGFPKVDASVLDFEHRKTLLIEEIVRNDPDVICLQEVDKYEFFRAELESRGYSCVRRDTARHGCVIAVKDDKWTIVSSWSETLTPDTTQICLVVELADKRGEKIRVATTHLKAKSGFASTRTEQVNGLIRLLDRDTDILTIIAGDFNAHVDEECVSVMSMHYSSAYPLQSDSFTTIKVRDQVVTRNIDYIWHDHRLSLTRRLALPSLDQFTYPYLPSADYPSDHISLFAEFLY